MNWEDFNNIDLKNAGNLPLPVKAVLLGGLSLLILAAAYWFLWRPALDDLDQAKAKEEQLRQVYVSKKEEAINLDAYKQQMAISRPKDTKDNGLAREAVARTYRYLDPSEIASQNAEKKKVKKGAKK